MKGANLALPFALVFTLISVASCDDVDSELDNEILKIICPKAVKKVNEAKDILRPAVSLINEKEKDKKMQDVVDILRGCKASCQEVESKLKVELDDLRSSSGRDEAIRKLGKAKARVEFYCAYDRKPVIDQQLQNMLMGFTGLIFDAASSLRSVRQ